ncbi:hypothetical protein BU17DRAFT_59914 [Hysterangium stoloniferum]|nr:hypothetical protein BU17DRAFT_59914 [Hysterangium stoloniferum]
MALRMFLQFVSRTCWWCNSTSLYEVLMKQNEELRQIILQSASLNQSIPAMIPTHSYMPDFLPNINPASNLTHIHYSSPLAQIQEQHDIFTESAEKETTQIESGPSLIEASDRAVGNSPVTVSENISLDNKKCTTPDIAPTPDKCDDDGQTVASYDATTEPGSILVPRKVSASLERSVRGRNQKKENRKGRPVRKLSPVPFKRHSAVPTRTVPAISLEDVKKLEDRMDRLEDYMQATTARGDIHKGSVVPGSQGTDQRTTRRLVRDHFQGLLFPENRDENFRVPWASLGSVLASQHQRLLNWPESIEIPGGWKWSSTILGQSRVKLLCRTTIEDWTSDEKCTEDGATPVIVSSRNRVLLRLSDLKVSRSRTVTKPSTKDHDYRPDVADSEDTDQPSIVSPGNHIRRRVRDHFQGLLFPGNPDKNIRVPWASLGRFLASHHQRLLNWPESVKVPEGWGWSYALISGNKLKLLCRTTIEDWTSDEKCTKDGATPVIVSSRNRVLLRLSDLNMSRSRTVTKPSAKDHDYRPDVADSEDTDQPSIVNRGNDMRRRVRDHFQGLLFPGNHGEKIRIPWASLGRFLASHHQRLLNWPESIKVPEGWGWSCALIGRTKLKLLCRTTIEDWTSDEKHTEDGATPLIVSNRNRVLLRLSDLNASPSGTFIESKTNKLDYRIAIRRHFRKILFGSDFGEKPFQHIPWTSMGEWLYTNRKRIIGWPHSAKYPMQGSDILGYTSQESKQLCLTTLEEWADEEKDIIHAEIPLVISDNYLVVQKLGDLEEFRALAAKKGKQRATTLDLESSESDSDEKEESSDKYMDDTDQSQTSYRPKVLKRKRNVCRRQRRTRRKLYLE